MCVTNMTGYISDLIWSQSRRLSVVVLIVVCLFVCFVFVLPFCYLVYNTAVGACLLCGVFFGVYSVWLVLLIAVLIIYIHIRSTWYYVLFEKCVLYAIWYRYYVPGSY